MIKYILKSIEEYNKAMRDLGYPIGYPFMCVYTGYIPIFLIGEDVTKKNEKDSL